MELTVFALLIPAFIAGLLTFLAPCTLPLVPAYLGFVSGVSLKELEDPEKALMARRKILLNGLFFVIGFSAIFVLFGTLAGFIGSELNPYRVWLTRIGGVLVIVFGLFMLNVVKIPFLHKERRIKIPSFLKRGNPFSSLVIGSAFGVGWTPCVGPILGSILLLASASATALEGAFLLSVFSLGLAIPFLLMALGISRASKYIERWSKYLSIISFVGGIFLILLGILLLTDNMVLLISYGYRIFDFINYDALLDYL